MFRRFAFVASFVIAIVRVKLDSGIWMSSTVPSIPSGPGSRMNSGGAPISSTEPTNPLGLGCRSGWGPSRKRPWGLAPVLFEIAAQLFGLLYFAVKIARSEERRVGKQATAGFAPG